MSGGSYDYVCFKIDDAAESIRNTETDPRRATFKKLLKLVSEAMHDIEWVDSCDYGPGDDYKAIDAVFAFLGNNPETIKKAHAYDGLKDTLQKYFKETVDHITPEEKSELAFKEQQAMQEFNKKICSIGACIHKEHQ